VSLSGVNRLALGSATILVSNNILYHIIQPKEYSDQFKWRIFIQSKGRQIYFKDFQIMRVFLR
jgi:hypothetical protein